MYASSRGESQIRPQTLLPSWASQEHFLRGRLPPVPQPLWSVQIKGGATVPTGKAGRVVEVRVGEEVLTPCNHADTRPEPRCRPGEAGYWLVLGPPAPLLASCLRAPPVPSPRGAGSKPGHLSPSISSSCPPAHALPTPTEPLPGRAPSSGLRSPPASRLCFIVLLFPFAKGPCLCDVAVGGH